MVVIFLPSFRGENSFLLLNSATRSAYMQFLLLLAIICSLRFVGVFGGFMVLLLGIFVFMMIAHVD